jgi:NAD(P)H-dependent flavin oxidoreductase YrpB (nitropropane dioxygenase family)
MAGTVKEALRGIAAGADVIIAQDSEGGGHVGWMATMTLVPMVVDAVGDIPVMAAGGLADGRGLAASIAPGAQGALMGTRFLATAESPLHPNFKQAIVDSDGHDTVLIEIPDLTTGQVGPGAMSRAQRNQFIERWTGREWEIRANRAEIFEDMLAARKAGDVDNAPLSFGQDAGLIHDIPNSAELIQRITEEAAEILGR